MSRCSAFTKTGIESLPITGKQYLLSDTNTPGLHVMVSPGGTKTFVFHRKFKNKNIRIKIGRVYDLSIENARKQADIIRSELITGKLLHMALLPKKKGITFEALYLRYYNEHALLHTKRPFDNWKHMYNHIIPKIGKDETGSISKSKMKEIHREMGVNTGKGQANRMLDMTSAIFNFGLNEEIYEGKNPCKGIKRYKRNSRDRFLTKKELKSFFAALEEEDKIYQDFFKLSLFIGARKATMLAMKYSEIDFENTRWRLSADQSKNDDINIYVLSEPASEILKQRYRDNQEGLQSAYVFPGDGADGHLKDPKKSLRRIRDRMSVRDFTIHDLRRTLASYMAINNTSLPIIGRALNHKSHASTEIYARLSQDPVLNALNNAASNMLSKVGKDSYWQQSSYVVKSLKLRMTISSEDNRRYRCAT